MALLRLESIEPPLDAPGVGAIAVRVLGRAEAMGLLPSGAPITRLDRAALERTVRRISSAAGIGREVLAELRATGRSASRLERVLRRLYEELEHSPAPAGEWRSLLAILGGDLLAELLGISLSSVRRYATGTRPTPDDVAERLHVLALLIADLSGSYNDFGVRRWFRRPRPQLDGRAPAEFLSGAWRPHDPAVERVRELARAVTAGQLAT